MEEFLSRLFSGAFGDIDKDDDLSVSQHSVKTVRQFVSQRIAYPFSVMCPVTIFFSADETAYQQHVYGQIKRSTQS
jgi:hypothetical protein